MGFKGFFALASCPSPVAAETFLGFLVGFLESLLGFLSI
jgi:hypothetical protein